MGYSKDETIKAAKNLLPASWYKKPCVGWRGKTSDTRKRYSDIIAEEIWENISAFETIKPLERRKSYKVNHDKNKKQTGTNRAEENFAKKIVSKKIDILGYIFDFQVPLKDKEDDKAGKIDLVSFNKNTGRCYLVELKTKNNKESLLRPVLEIATYYRQLHLAKFIADFSNELPGLTEKDIYKAVLLEEGSKSEEIYSILGSESPLRKLINALGVDILIFREVKDSVIIISQESIR